MEKSLTVKKISEIFSAEKKTLSFEFFPPKTDAGFKNLYEKVAPRLACLNPDFFSVTCGADGKDIKVTEEVAQTLQKMFPGISVMQHISIMAVSRNEKVMCEYLEKIKTSVGIRNILALRGDILDNEKNKNSTDDSGGLRYSSDLCRLIRKQFGDYFSIGVAAYPDGHPECSTLTDCDNFLKMKFDSGADFAITQFFFENEKYTSMLRRLESKGVNTTIKRIIPGILPVTDFERLLSFASKCDVEIPKSVNDYFADSIHDKERMKNKGIEYAYHQSVQLLKSGAMGVHIFTLNQAGAPFEIASRLRSEGLL